MDEKKAFFIQRLNDHVQYLDKITQTVRGKAEFTGCDCHGCQLGKWLDGSGRDDVAAYSDDVEMFDTLLTRHEQFHRISGEVLAAHAQGDSVGSYRSMTEMHKLSGQLVSLLLGLDRKSRLAASA